MAPAGGGNIKVVVRVRPFNSRGKFASPPIHYSYMNKKTNDDGIQKSTAAQNVSCK
jgi:hypothetical protein